MIRANTRNLTIGRNDSAQSIVRCPSLIFKNMSNENTNQNSQEQSISRATINTPREQPKMPPVPPPDSNTSSNIKSRPGEQNDRRKD